jgi:hypothetical protein
VSHKLGRLLVPWCLVGALVSSMVLAFTSLFYAAAFVAQLGFYGLALIGGWAERRELSGTDRATDGSAPPRDTRGAPASTREQALVERR